MPVAVGLMADSHKEAASGFNPAALTDVVGWWDATDASTFTLTTGSQFTQWRDKSANARHLTAEYDHVNLTRSGSINGLTAVLANHTGVEMTARIASFNILTLLDATAKTDCMQFAVCKFNAFTALTYPIGMQGTTYRVMNNAAAGGGVCDIVNHLGGRLNWGGGGTMTINTPYVFACYRNGVNMKVFLNGTQVASKTNASDAAASEVGTFKLMAGVNFGHLGEAIHVARYNATDFTDTTAYLKTKWGIA